MYKVWLLLVALTTQVLSTGGVDCPVATDPILSCTLNSGQDYSCAFTLPVDVTSIQHNISVVLYMHADSEISVNHDFSATVAAHSSCVVIPHTQDVVQYKDACDNSIREAVVDFQFTDNGEITGVDLSGTFTITLSTSSTLRPGLIVYATDEATTSASWTFPSSLLADCEVTNMDVVVDCPDPPDIGQARLCTIRIPINVNQVNSLVRVVVEVLGEEGDMAINHIEPSVVLVDPSCIPEPFHTFSAILYYEKGDSTTFANAQFIVYFHGESNGGQIGYWLTIAVSLSSSADVLLGTNSPTLMVEVDETKLTIPLLNPSSPNLDPVVLCSSTSLKQSQFLSCRIGLAISTGDGSLIINIDSGDQLSLLSMHFSPGHCRQCTVADLNVQTVRSGCGLSQSSVTWSDYLSISSAALVWFDVILQGNELYWETSVPLVITVDYGSVVTDTKTITLDNNPVVYASKQLKILSTDNWCPSVMARLHWLDVRIELEVGHHNQLYIKAEQNTNPASDLLTMHAIRVLNWTEGVYLLDNVERHTQLHTFSNNENTIRVGLGRVVTVHNQITPRITVRVFAVPTISNTIADIIDVLLTVESDQGSAPTTLNQPTRIKANPGLPAPDSPDISNSNMSVSTDKKGTYVKYGEAVVINTLIELDDTVLASMSTSYGQVAGSSSAQVESSMAGSESVFAVERMQIAYVGLNLFNWIKSPEDHVTDTIAQSGVTLTKSLQLINIGPGYLIYEDKSNPAAKQIRIVTQLRFWPNDQLSTDTQDVTVTVNLVGTIFTRILTINVDIAPEPTLYKHLDYDLMRGSLYVKNELNENGLIVFPAGKTTPVSLRLWLPQSSSFYVEMYNDEREIEMFKLDTEAEHGLHTSYSGNALVCQNPSHAEALYTTSNNIATDILVRYDSVKLNHLPPPSAEASEFELEVTIPTYFNVLCDANDTYINFFLTNAIDNSTDVENNLLVYVFADEISNYYSLDVDASNKTSGIYELGDSFVVKISWTIEANSTIPVDWFGVQLELPDYLTVTSATLVSSTQTGATVQIDNNPEFMPTIHVNGTRNRAGDSMMINVSLLVGEGSSAASGVYDLETVIGVSLYWEACASLNAIGDWPQYSLTNYVAVAVNTPLKLQSYSLSTQFGGDILDCQISSSSNYGISTALNARITSSNFWSPAVYPGSQDYLEIYFGKDVSIDSVVLERDNSGTLRFPRSVSISVLHASQLSWETMKTFTHPYDWNGEKCEISLDYPVSVYSIRILVEDVNFDHATHETNPLGLRVAEFKGHKEFVNMSRECMPSATSLSTNYERRAMLATNENAFVCNWSPNKLHSCYVSIENSWRALDPNIVNVVGYADGKLYGLMYDKVTYAVSPDTGSTWLPLEGSPPPFTHSHVVIPGQLNTGFDAIPISQNGWSAKFDGIYYLTETTPRFIWTEFC